MQHAKIEVSGNRATVTDLTCLTAGTIGATVGFSFDESWDGMTKTLVWRGSGVTLDDINCTGVIPAEVLSKVGGRLFVGVYGTKAGTATPTIWANLGNILPGADPSGDESTDPTLPVWAQTKAVADQANAAAKEAKAVADQAGETAIHALEMSDNAIGQASEAMDTANGAMTIAKGRATGYVFDTYGDMRYWLYADFIEEDGTPVTDLTQLEEAEKNRAMLNLGDNLYIRDKGVPDYWWDGEREQQLETQKVDLTEYVKNTDYATVGDKAGVVRFLNISTGTYGFQASQSYPGAVLIAKAKYSDIDMRTSKYKPIVPYNLDYAVHSVLGKQPKFISSYTGDIDEDAYAAISGPGSSGEYIGQIRLQGGNRAAPRRVWMYIGIDTDDPETGIPVWLDLLSGETWGPW